MSFLLSSLYKCLIICSIILTITACAQKASQIEIPSVENTTQKIPHITLIKPTKGRHISSYFGMRKHPIKKRHCMHTGIDITGSRGDKIIAAADGTVAYTGRKGSYGLIIDLDIGEGVILRYAHLDKILVKKGMQVTQGQHIGKLGRTGRITAPHLHFEVRYNNIPLDPLQFIAPEHHWAAKPPPKLKKKKQNIL